MGQTRSHARMYGNLSAEIDNEIQAPEWTKSWVDKIDMQWGIRVSGLNFSRKMSNITKELFRRKKMDEHLSTTYIIVLNLQALETDGLLCRIPWTDLNWPAQLWCSRSWYLASSPGYLGFIFPLQCSSVVLIVSEHKALRNTLGKCAVFIDQCWNKGSELGTFADSFIH